KFEAGKHEHEKGEEENDAARRRELVEHRQEKSFSDVQRPVPPGQPADLVPIDIAAIEAVRGARVCAQLRPKLINPAAFADALPQVWLRGLRRTSGFRSSFIKWHERSIGHEVRNARCRKSLVFALQRAAELNFAKPEAVAQFVRGLGEFFEFFAV